MLLPLRWIVRPEREVKEMLAIHALVHHKIGVEGRTLPRLEGRRTDDRLGRSAALNCAHWRGRVERKSAVTCVRYFELGAYGLVQRLATEIYLLLIKC